VKREILDHAGLILGREATRTLTARALHERITLELGLDFGYAPFLEALASRPDRFTIVTERAPFRDGANLPDIEMVLEHAGVLRCATVVLADTPPSDEPCAAAADDIAAALAATLGDAHTAILDLLQLERADATAASGQAAVIELEELRRECTAQLRASTRAALADGSSVNEFQLQFQIPNFEIQREADGNVRS
jgi:hypothetical protein